MTDIIEKIVNHRGKLACLLTSGGILIYLLNMGQDIFTNTFIYGLYGITPIIVLVIQELLVFPVAYFLNTAYWKYKGIPFKNSCPIQRIVYFEWILMGVLSVHFPLILKWIGVSMISINSMLAVTHHLFFGPLIISAFWVIINTYLIKGSSIESFLEKWEIIPEVDNENVIILSVAIGVILHIIIDIILL